MSEPLLQDLIRIQQSGVRSIRLEDDLFDDERAQGYVLTAQSLQTLERIFNGVEGHGARAWTLTGPYGAGKSYFGLFLSRSLDGETVARQAHEKLMAHHPDLAERILRWAGETRGLLGVPVTGSRVSFQACLERGFSHALGRLDASFATPFLKELKQAASFDSRTLLEWIRRFVTELRTRGGFAGVILIFDELGKALEYAAAHPLESDIYLLQELAEFASRSGETPFIFVGILHQAFEQYASLLDRGTQREWAKVQGRFEDIPYLEPPAQQMRLLARAFSKYSGDLPEHSKKEFILSDWLPDAISIEEFAVLCQNVYPLHPSAFVSLPLIFRRLGQNERSIFTYLTSHEPYGFQDFLANHRRGDYLRLPHLFDYLAANYEGRIYASNRARPLTEALERLASTPALSPDEQDVLKTIAMLNWIGENSSLQSREELILTALAETLDRQATLRAALMSLKRRSLIAYRGFNQTYVVWQGSDVDLEERLQAAYAAQSGTFSLAETLQIYLPPRPLIARRHSYKTGALRFFNVQYVDMVNRDSISLTPQTTASGLVLLCLPASLIEVEQFNQWAQSSPLSKQQNLVIGVAGRAIRLKELVQELRSLYWIKENTPALRGDRVAERELRARLALMESLIRNELDEALNLHQISALVGCQWYHCGEDVSGRVRHGLSALLSDLCDDLYPSSPRIWNELLNRRELTTQGAAARRLLIEGILTRPDQPFLGIQKFPPERSMYEALLRRGEMHRFDGERWYICQPANNDLNLLPTWGAIYDFVFSGLPEPRPLNDLYAQLAAPPYGVTLGVMPVLLAVFYKAYEQEMTLYKDGTLLVEPEIADWEVLLRRPELFSLAGCRVTGLRAAVLERIARGLHVSPFVMPVVRALIGRLKALPEHAWRTRKLPEVALNLRRAVEVARSPERFLFVEVPQALGLPPFEEGEFDAERFEVFFAHLNVALDALSNATPRLLTWARNVWLTACGLPPDEEGWLAFCQQAEDLARRVTHPQLSPLLRRVADSTDSRAALESVLAYIANRPLRTWTDADVERFEAQAYYLGDLWREENGVSIDLPPDTQIRVRALADRLEATLLSSGEPMEAMEAALRLLLLRVKKANERML